MRLRAAGGTLRFRAAGGTLRSRAAGGTLRFRAAGGTLRFRAAGGTLRLRAAGGTLRLRAAGGALRFRAAEDWRCRAQSRLALRLAAIPFALCAVRFLNSSLLAMMIKQLLLILTTLLLLSAAAFGQPAVDRLAIDGSPARVSAAPGRFQQVAPSLFRSAAADGDNDYAFYRTHGIATIIDLRQGPDAEEERATAERLGFDYINIPLNRLSGVADYRRAERAFFHAIDSAQGGVVFHCKHGKDRTGLMAALYRVEREGWTPERAVNEWRSFGGYGDDWGTGIQAYFNARVKSDGRFTCSDLFR